MVQEPPQDELFSPIDYVNLHKFISLKHLTPQWQTEQKIMAETTPWAWQDELHPATGVDHACECGFFSVDQPCLVLAVGQRLEVYTISEPKVRRSLPRLTHSWSLDRLVRTYLSGDTVFGR